MKNKYIFPFKPKWVVYMSRLEHDVKKVREQEAVNEALDSLQNLSNLNNDN